MKLVHWPLMSDLLHLVQRSGRGRSPPRPLLAVTARPSTASVPITLLLCNNPLLCSFNVGIKGLRSFHSDQREGRWNSQAHAHDASAPASLLSASIRVTWLFQKPPLCISQANSHLRRGRAID